MRNYRAGSTAQSGLQMSTPKYTGRAACADTDPDLFFPIGTTGPAILQAEQAKAICHVCPIKEACLADAMETWDDYGVRGGTTPVERRVLARRSATTILRSKDADHRDRTELVRQLASQV